jgi:hypothetical protein
MSAPTEMLNEIEDQVIDTLTQMQEPVLSSVRKAVELVEGVIPDVAIPQAEKLPSAKELVDSQYAFATRLLKLNHEFALALLDAIKPLELKVLPEAKPAPKTTRKAPAKPATEAA